MLIVIGLNTKNLCAHLILAKSQLLVSNEIIETNTIEREKVSQLIGDFVSLNYEKLILNYLNSIPNKEDTLNNITNSLKAHTISIEESGVTDLLTQLKNKIYKSNNSAISHSEHRYKII